jgi:hypothetical protein
MIEIVPIKVKKTFLDLQQMINIKLYECVFVWEMERDVRWLIAIKLIIQIAMQQDRLYDVMLEKEVLNHQKGLIFIASMMP